MPHRPLGAYNLISEFAAQVETLLISHDDPLKEWLSPGWQEPDELRGRRSGLAVEETGCAGEGIHFASEGIHSASEGIHFAGEGIHFAGEEIHFASWGKELWVLGFNSGRRTSFLYAYRGQIALEAPVSRCIELSNSARSQFICSKTESQFVGEKGNSAD